MELHVVVRETADRRNEEPAHERKPRNHERLEPHRKRSRRDRGDEKTRKRDIPRRNHRWLEVAMSQSK